jgi:hypothetical protein
MGQISVKAFHQKTLTLKIPTAVFAEALKASPSALLIAGS